MDKQNVHRFGRAVLSELTSERTTDAFDIAVRRFERAGLADPSSKRLIKQCATQVRALASLTSDDSPTPHWPETVLTSEALEAVLAPEVELIREETFGTREAPFQNETKAWQWIECERRSQPKGAWTGRSLAYYKPGSDTVHRTPVAKGSKLADLQRHVEQLERDTGAQQALLVAHLLSGLPLLVPRLSVRVSRFMGVPRPTEHHVIIRATNPTREDFLAAYEAVRQQTTRAPSPVDRQDLELWQASSTTERAPDQTHRDWLEVVRIEANRRLKAAKLKEIPSWNAARMRLYRLRDKLPSGLL